MSQEIENALKIATDAYKSNNLEECITFCNNVFMIDPDNENAKALKGAARLADFDLDNAYDIASEALNIWESITGDSIDDDYKDIVIIAAFDFRDNWLQAAKNYQKSVSNASDDVKKAASKLVTEIEYNYKKFMEGVASFKWLQEYPVFLQYTLDLVKKQIASLKNVTYAKNLITANKGKEGELGELATQIEAAFKKLKIRRLIKWGIILTIIIAIIIFIEIKFS